MEKMFYLAELFGGINNVFTALGIMSAIGLVITTIGRLCSYSDKDEKKAWRTGNLLSILICVVSVLIATIIPSRQTYLLMMGGKVVDQTIENNPNVKEIPEKTIELLNSWLDKELQDKDKDSKNE